MADSQPPSRPQGHQERGSRLENDSPEHKRGLFSRLADMLSHAPENRDELRDVLVDANRKGIIDSETLVMIDGAVRLADMTAADAMMPVSRVDMIDINQPLNEIFNIVINGGHSRLPVYEGDSEDDDENRQNIIGVLIAKDLLKLSRSPDLNVRTLLRQPFYVPESRSLNQMLADFRADHQHMALVVDEFGRFSGVITIEDVLEEIVGEIEDEFDLSDDEGDIYTLTDGSYRVAGDTSLERVNEAFNVHLVSEDVETIGGYISHELSHVPYRGETYTVENLQFSVLHTRAGMVKWFRVVPLDAAK